MKKRKFGDGGEIPPGGRFDSDTYSRARKWMESGLPDSKKESKPASKSSDSRTPYSNEGRDSKPKISTSDRSEIPKDTSVKAPASTGADTSGPSNVGRLLAGLGAGAGVAAIGKGVSSAYKAKSALAANNAASKAAQAAEIAKSAASKQNGVTGSRMISQVEEGLKKAKDSGALKPKESVAEHTAKQMDKVTEGLKAAKKSGALKPKANVKAETPSAAAKSTKSPRSRTKYDDSPGVEYKKGGTVRGMGCATKGAKKARMM